MYDHRLTHITSAGDVRTSVGGVMRVQSQYERAASNADWEFDDEDEYEYDDGPGLLARLWHWMFA